MAYRGSGGSEITFTGHATGSTLGVCCVATAAGQTFRDDTRSDRAVARSLRASPRAGAMESQRMHRVGVEIGGTFTDLVAFGPDGVSIRKVPSVPARPDEGAFAALAASGLAMAGIGEFIHGSTVATNAVLERKGGRLAFLVTRGFRDILLLQRHDRTRIFDLFYKKPEPLAARADTFEVGERIAGDGSVLEPLDLASEGAALKAQLSGGYDAVAICLLNGFLNPAHEQALAAWIAAELPGLRVTCSHRRDGRVPRVRAGDSRRRCRPSCSRSLTAISAASRSGLAAAGFVGPLQRDAVERRAPAGAAMRKSAITALFSGPAAGVVGAVRQVGAVRLRRYHHLRHGRHLDRRLPGRAAASPTRQRDRDRRPADPDAGPRHRHGRRRRRQHRLGRRRRHAARRPALRPAPPPGPACYGAAAPNPTITDAQSCRRSAARGVPRRLA
jgi:hypothetical protein